EQTAAREAELRAAQASLEEARTQLAVAKANLLQADAAAHQLVQARAQARRASAQLDNARKNLSYTVIRAPRDGLVIDRYVEEGTVITSGRSAITQGTNIVTLADVSRMYVLAEVDEADIGQVKVGQPVEIEVETFPDETFAGKVTQVYPKGEEIENVTIFKVRIEVDKPRGVLRPGMTAEASIIIDRRDNVLAVPNEAVFERMGKKYVEVLQRGKPREVEIQTGLASFEWTEIRSGLQEGQEVVLAGAGLPTMGREAGGTDARRQMRRMMRIGGRRR
ncbi:MAG: efflux RND transporter periplasmic adaptor subunit, partial [Armatimonadota bacterium]